MRRIETETDLERRNRVVTNHLKERGNCIVLVIDKPIDDDTYLSPFGFHFELNRKRLKEIQAIERRKRITQWFAWIALIHHKFGVRHLILVSILVIYICIGAAVFVAIESPNELESLNATIAELEEMYTREVDDILNITSEYSGEELRLRLRLLVQDYGTELLETEGKYVGSSTYKIRDIEKYRVWYFASGTFFCMQLFTTIGYGTIACSTDVGKALTVIYACFGIPLMLVVVGDIGGVLEKYITKAYLFVLIKYKKLRKRSLSKTKIENTRLPTWLALIVVFGYMAGCAGVIAFADLKLNGFPGGIGYGDSFYFTFISLATIGLGDVMPLNYEYSPLLAISFLFGIALLSLLNNSLYKVGYDTFYEVMHAMEYQLERIHMERVKRRKGFQIVKDLEPAFRLLVCSFPHIDPEEREGMLRNMRYSFRRPRANTQVLPRPQRKMGRVRTISDSQYFSRMNEEANGYGSGPIGYTNRGYGSDMPISIVVEDHDEEENDDTESEVMNMRSRSQTASDIHRAHPHSLLTQRQISWLI